MKRNFGKIEWNKVTWYSKAAAFFMFITLPFLAFYGGVKYGILKNKTDFFITDVSFAYPETSGYLRNILERNGELYVEVNIAKTYFGSEAFLEAVRSNVCASQSEPEECLPYNYFVSDFNRIAIFKVSPDAEVYMQTFGAGRDGAHKPNEKISFSDLRAVINEPRSGVSGFLFDIYFDRGEVVKFRQSITDIISVGK